MREVELAELSSANARREAIERELAMLRLQMDPHFVSNSLVSVQEFLQIGDPDEAEAYLVLFSGLIREVLERSVHPLTRLEDALDWLRRYVALEEKRLDAPLRFVVEGDEAIAALRYLDPNDDTAAICGERHSAWHRQPGSGRDGYGSVLFPGGG
ncbi:MAG: histidine kinase [Bacteroidota bacterium]